MHVPLRKIREQAARGPSAAARRRRRALGALTALLLAAMGALALSTAPAYGEGSVDINGGPDANVRHSARSAITVRVYARAGETLQMATSAMGLGGAANILVYPPGTDVGAGAPVHDCVARSPGTGRIDSRAEELAGPAPNPGGYRACEYVAPADGIYSVRMIPWNQGDSTGGGGTIGAPITTRTQNYRMSLWDVTVRDGGVVRPGRAFANVLNLASSYMDPTADFAGFFYTRTGYEYAATLFDHRGLNWTIAADDRGVVDRATGERIFASFQYGSDVISDTRLLYDDAIAPLLFDPDRLVADRRHPIFFNRVDPVAIAGPGGLGELRGFATAPITSASEPLSDLRFTGTGGQPAGTSPGAGGRVAFDSLRAMDGLDYALELDLDRNGTFGGGRDVGDRAVLDAAGGNGFAWDGRDAAGAVVGCGTYQYRVRATLAEVHFTQDDVENTGGFQIERLSLPGDPALGHPLAASYNDVDPYKGIDTTNGSPDRVTDGISGPGFHAWTDNTGNNDYIDTWTQLPDVEAIGSFTVLCADLAIAKSAGSARYQPGGELSFTLTATNHGPDAAVDTVVTDTLPAGLSVTATDPQCTVVGQTVTCRLASLAAGARHAFRITTRVAPDATGCLRNTAAVGSGTHDPNAANNQTDICVPPAESDVSVVKTSDTSPVVPGEQVVYRLRVSNRGPDAAIDVVVTDRLPSALRFVSASRGCTEADGVVTCTIASLAAGASETFTITTRAPSGLRRCPANTATVRSLTLDTDLTNNDDSACPPLRGRANLSIVKTASATQLLAGGQVMYTLVVRNAGPSDATGVLVEDPLATGLTLVSAQPGQGACTVADGRVRCNLGTLEAGGATQILVTATAPRATACVDNTATVRGDQQDPNQRDNSSTARVCATVPPPPPVAEPAFDLVVTKRANRRVVQLGQTVTYRIVVANKGPDAAPDARLTDTFGARGRLVSVRTTQGRCRRGLPVRCELGTIRAGARATITVRLRPSTPGRGKRNVASATARGRDRDPSDNVDRAVVTVRRVNLVLTKRVDRRVLRAGQTATYTIRVANRTRGVARRVRTCDRLPSGLVHVRSTPRARLSRGAHCWTVRRLGPGQSRTYRVVVRALRGTSGRKVNTAVTSSPDARTRRARAVVRVIAGGVRAGGVTG